MLFFVQTSIFVQIWTATSIKSFKLFDQATNILLIFTEKNKNEKFVTQIAQKESTYLKYDV